MKKHLLSIVFSLVVVIGSSQSYYNLFTEITQNDCELTGDSIGNISNWEFFQTSDGTISGKRIESCFDVFDTRRVFVENAIDSLPLFFKNMTTIDAEIASDYPYSFSFNVDTSEEDFCNCNFDCALPFCFSAKIKLSAITGNDTLHYEKIITDPRIESQSIHFENCFLTEKADKTILNDIEITFAKEKYSEDEEFRISSLSLFEFDGVDFENRIIPNDFKINSAYFVSPLFFNPYEFGATLVRYLGPGVPSPQNIFYYDLIPEDSTTQQTINIVLGFDTNLLFQNYTGLRGAYVANNQDSIRHKFNLINDGSTICFFQIIELIFSNNANFIHKSGLLEFQKAEGCMQFRDQARFVMKENSYLEYGKNGIGLMALQDQSQIHLEANSKMDFNGEIILKPTDVNKMSLVLNEGSELTFGSQSKITSSLDASDIQLTVYLNGGELNTTNLDPESLRYLNIVDYTNNSTKMKYSEFEMYPNPSPGQITLTNNSIEKVKFDIIDISGKLITTEYIDALSNKKIDLSNFEGGIYFIKNEFGTQRKLVINR